MKFQNVSPLLGTIVALSILTVCVAEQKSAQTEKKVGTGNSAAMTTGHQADWKVTDQMLASCVAIDNQEEVAIAQFALKQTKNDDVRKFAQMLVTDHQGFLKKLTDYAPEATRDGYLGETNDSHAAADSQPRKLGEVGEKGLAKPNIITRTTAKPPIKDGERGMADATELQRELAQQCLADTKAMLKEKDADEFDKCFIGFQIAKHAAMKTKLDVFQRHASEELATLFFKAHETTATHFDHAEKLMQTLAESKTTTAEK